MEDAPPGRGIFLLKTTNPTTWLFRLARSLNCFRRDSSDSTVLTVVLGAYPSAIMLVDVALFVNANLHDI